MVSSRDDRKPNYKGSIMGVTNSSSPATSFHQAFMASVDAERAYSANQSDANKTTLISAIQAVCRIVEDTIATVNSSLQDDMIIAVADASELAERHGIAVPRLQAA